MESTDMTIMFSELLTGLITVRDSKTLADVMYLRAPNEAHTAWLISPSIPRYKAPQISKHHPSSSRASIKKKSKAKGP